jgi:hypothetical protein
MACRDWEGVSDSVDMKEYDRIQDSWAAAIKRLDKVTRVACELAKNLNAEEQTRLSSEAQAWIKEHREADAEREKAEKEQKRRNREEAARRLKREKEQAAALNKLTHEERRVLGLPDPA